ncbi:MAG: helix-turn-helix domain-containing protein [Nitrospira sp.]|nr:helix-turn-helix domain-containing protein [Nitrospira sp.]
METSDLSRSELARRMEVSPAYITKVLSGNPNLTIKSLIKLSDALGQELHLELKNKVEAGHVATTVGATYRKLKPVRCHATTNSCSPRGIR